MGAWKDLGKPHYFEPFSSANIQKYLYHVFNEQHMWDFETMVKPFNGPGVYAIYMPGGHSLYPTMMGDWERPMYVGKAELPGGCTGPIKNECVPSLYKRLEQHRETLAAAENLVLSEMKFRFLVLNSMWVETIEKFLMQNHRPIWNRCIRGFGMCNPGENRLGTGQKKPDWHILHPGVEWAKTPTLTMDHITIEELVERIYEHK